MVQLKPARASSPSFVDLGPNFQYSKNLARCCAWGLGVLTRTYLKEAPARFWRASDGTGDRLRDQTAGTGERGPAQPGFRLEPNSRSFSPEQICLAVGRGSGPCVIHGR